MLKKYTLAAIVTLLAQPLLAAQTSNYPQSGKLACDLLAGAGRKTSAIEFQTKAAFAINDKGYTCIGAYQAPQADGVLGEFSITLQHPSGLKSQVLSLASSQDVLESKVLRLVMGDALCICEITGQ